MWRTSITYGGVEVSDVEAGRSVVRDQEGAERSLPREQYNIPKSVAESLSTGP